MCGINKKARRLHKEFVRNNGHEPRFADIKVRWEGDECDTDEIVKLKDFCPSYTENDPDFEKVLFFFDGVDGLCRADEDYGFIISDIIGFSDNC